MKAIKTWLSRGAFMASLLCGACESPPPIVNSNEVFVGDLACVNRELTQAQSQRVLQVMADTRTQQNIDNTQPLEKCPQGRWSDVYQAALIASRKVEMAVVMDFVLPDGMRFTIITLNNDSGELVIKGNAEQGVTSATATLGLFGERTEAADQLVHSFYSQLHELGSIPRPREYAPTITEADDPSTPPSIQ